MFISREKDEFMAVRNPEVQTKSSASGEVEKAREGRSTFERGKTADMKERPRRGKNPRRYRRVPG